MVIPASGFNWAVRISRVVILQEQLRPVFRNILQAFVPLRSFNLLNPEKGARK